MHLLLGFGRCALLSSIVLLVLGCASSDKVGRIKNPKIVSSAFSQAHAKIMKKWKRTASAVLDENSVPHLFAENRSDLFFSQGYTHAYFRLWQMETNSRIVEGTLSEVIGHRGLKFDEFVFVMNLEELAQEALKKLEKDPVAVDMLGQYVAGVNARIEELEEDASLISSEFRSRGLKPRRFTSLDIVRLRFARSVGQFDPFSELRLSLARVRLGEEMFNEVFPWPNSKEIPVPLFKTDKPEPARPPSGKPAIAIDEFPLDHLEGTWIRGTNGTGSNAWTHAPSSTTDGKSYLANDFHVHFRLPGLYFPMQLSIPGLDFLGGSIAGQPGMVNGTNGKVAIGFVASMADVGDWYRLKIHPKDPSRYRWNGSWKRFEEKRRTVRVLGDKAVTLSRRSSAAGYMIPALRNRDGKGEPIEVAYRWTGFSYSRPMQAAIRLFDLQEAKDCAAPEILKNLGWLVLTCIDDQGRSGYWVSGISPSRNLKSDPRLIQWAERDDDVWQEASPISQSSASYPAEAGWPLANQMSLSNKSGSYFGWNFSPPFRAMTIKRRLNERSPKKWDLEAILQLQSDISDERFTLVRDELVRIGAPFLNSELPSQRNCERTIVQELKNWDGLQRSESLGATMAIAWLRHITLHLGRAWYGDALARVAEPFPQWKIVQAIQGPSDAIIWKTPSGKSDKEEFIRGVLKRVCQTRFKNLGTRPEEYHWGRINSPRFSSLSGDLPDATKDLRADGSFFSLFSQGGDHGTILRAVMNVKSPPDYYFAAPDGTEGDPRSPLSSAWTKTWEARSVMKLPRYSRQEIEAEHGK